MIMIVKNSVVTRDYIFPPPVRGAAALEVSCCKALGPQTSGQMTGRSYIGLDGVLAGSQHDQGEPPSGGGCPRCTSATADAALISRLRNEREELLGELLSGSFAATACCRASLDEIARLREERCSLLLVLGQLQQNDDDNDDNASTEGTPPTDDPEATLSMSEVSKHVTVPTDER